MNLELLFNSKRRFVTLDELAINGKVSVYELSKKHPEIDRSGFLRELAELEKIGFVESFDENGKTSYKLKENETNKKLIEFIESSRSTEVWSIAEEIPSGYLPYQMNITYNFHKFDNYFKKVGLTTPKSWIIERINRLVSVYVDFNSFDKFAEEVVSKAIAEPKWLEETIETAINNAEQLRLFSKEMKSINLSNSTDKELIKLFDDGNKIFFQLHLYGVIQTADWSKKGWTNTLQNLLRQKVPNYSEKQIRTKFATLTTPNEESLGSKETTNLIALKKHIEKNPKIKSAFNCEQEKLEEKLRDFPEFIKMVDDHVNDFGFLSFNALGPGNSRKEYLQILALMLANKYALELKKTKLNYDELEKELKLSQSEIELFKVLRKDVWFKGFRKDCMFEWWSQADRILAEFARRKYLSLTQMRMVLAGELSSLPELDELNKRSKYFVGISKNNQTIILSGEKAEKFIKTQTIQRPQTTDVNEFYGDCSYPGIITGTVKIVNVHEDMAKMEEGNILVSNVTTPDLMPAIRKAAAIVTDMGGITCHASIVSRELGIPCIVGTNIATKVLKNGDWIEVNANHGRVKILSKG